ncbi:MAG: MiaB/RimO family radical SAM methylthiotransferase [Patescibacteria group bacterium]
MYIPLSFNSFSFGCRVNEAEKIRFDQELLRLGFLQNKKNPDIYIINTCAVTVKAEREARQLIFRLRRDNPDLILIVTGCAATYWVNNKIWNNIPVDLIISNYEKENLARLVIKYLSTNKNIQINTQPNHLGKRFSKSDKFLSSGRMMIEIQNGCHRFCSYCIVPYLRGLPKSRTINEIIKQTKMYDSAVQEIVLTAINTEAYGKDTNENLTQLIDRLLQNTTVARISFGSIHPWSLTDEFFEFYPTVSTNQRFSSFFHIPIQSGCNKTLRLMKRDYHIEQIHEKLKKIKIINPLAYIATDVIVGFLNETEADFEKTLMFLTKSPIDKLHVFRFSKRIGTAAYYLAKRMKEPSPGEKIKRAHTLIALSKKKYMSFLQKCIGAEGQGLFIGSSVNGYQKALFENQIPVYISTNKSLSGMMKHVRITKLKEGILFGNLA